ncbi:MAG: peptidoglycan-binding protein [Burkholderiales bacterium]|nr:peptidoglycan-binding protein [Nitrosomonas sp.]MCP5273315.1 peptidoglycan-binding protein [Burkholderiales bacterium]
MAYTFLRWDDKLPGVGVLQKLLNRTGEQLVVDGIYGNNTKTAVQRFQRLRGLVPDGIVGMNTWPRISANANLPIFDCIDVFDPSLFNLEARDIRRSGGNPILIGGMSNGVEQAVSDIVNTAGNNVFLLRFHGHGASGIAGVSDGHGLNDGIDHRSSIDINNVRTLMPILRRLRPTFGSYGNIQFMHCSTGRGPNGRQLLQQIANGVGVPVTAAVRDQLGGGVATFKFEGPTYTAVPSGGILRSWCSSRPDFPGFTPR